MRPGPPWPSCPNRATTWRRQFAQTRAVVPVVLGVAGRTPQIKARFVYRGTANPFGHAAALWRRARRAARCWKPMPPARPRVNLIPDHDGVVRRMPLVFRLGGRLVPGMAAEALRVAGGGRRHHRHQQRARSPDLSVRHGHRGAGNRRRPGCPPTPAAACGCTMPPMSPSGCSIPMRLTAPCR